MIGSNVGGIKSTVVDGKTGFLVPPNDPVLLGQRILELLRSNKLMMYFKENAIRHVNENYTWMKATHLTANMYERIATQSPLREDDEDDPLSYIDDSFESLIETLQKVEAENHASPPLTQPRLSIARWPGGARCWFAAMAAALPKRSISQPNSLADSRPPDAAACR